MELTDAQAKALRAIGQTRVTREDVPGTDRIRYRYYRPYNPSTPNVAPAWITLPSRTVTALRDTGLVEFGQRAYGASEFSEWQEPVLLTESGRAMLKTGGD